MITSSELIKLVMQRNPGAKVDILKKAYMFAMEAHGSQKRLSGPPFFYHSAEVARILAEIGMDVSTIATGLLHDVLEDTNTSFEELEELFGSEIALLVRGVTMLSSVRYSSREEYQADNIRKFLLAISRDLRILIVKIVDRLHNMRTLRYVSIEKQKSIASYNSYTDEQLAPVRELNRKGQWYWDFVFVENSEGAHNSRLDADCLNKAEALIDEALALLN